MKRKKPNRPKKTQQELIQHAKDPQVIQKILGVLMFCCLTNANENKNFLFSEVRSVRIQYWEKNQEQRHQYLMDVALLCPGKEQRGSLATKSGSVFVFPILLGRRLCVKCVSELLSCSGSLIYKVRDEVQNKLLRCYENGNRGSMKDESKTGEAVADVRQWFEVYFSTVGDYMPHYNKVHLPPALYKDMHAIYLSDMQLQCVQYTLLAKNQWRAIWKQHFPHVYIGKYSCFATCDICATYKRALLEHNSLSERMALRDEQRLHIVFVREERAVYHKTRFLARSEPERYLSMILDGMDQKKTDLPWVWPLDKATASLQKIKTHVTGVIMHGHKPSSLLYTDFLDVPHDPNLTCHIINQSLLALEGPIPPNFLLQLDNTSKENKNSTVLVYLAMLVLLGVFVTVVVSFLPVGHTHEDIDQLFSRIAQLLRKSIVKTVPELMELLKKAFTKEGKPPVVRKVVDVANLREWCADDKPDIEGITKARSFKLYKKSDEKVYIQSKATLSEPDANYLPEAGSLFLDALPKGNPCKVPLKSKHLDAVTRTVAKYHDRKVLSEVELKQWNDWVHSEREREQSECAECYQLTTVLQQNGPRQRDTPDAIKAKRQKFTETQKALLQHLQQVGSDELHSCVWTFPSATFSSSSSAAPSCSGVSSSAADSSSESSSVSSSASASSSSSAAVSSAVPVSLEPLLVVRHGKEKRQKRDNSGRGGGRARGRGRGGRGRGRGRGGRSAGGSSLEEGAASDSSDERAICELLDQVSESDAEDSSSIDDWGVVDVTNRRVDTGKNLTKGKAAAKTKQVVRYEVHWELGGVTWETRTSWLQDWTVNLNHPYLSKKQVLSKMSQLDESAC